MPDFYGTVAAADIYHTARGNTAWAGSPDDKTAALLRASAYVDSFGNGPAAFTLWPGVKTAGRLQLRAWPRTGAFDIDGAAIDADTVPVEVEHATYEAALREIVAPGSLTPDYTPGSQVKREKVDVLEVEYMTAADTGNGNPVRPVVDTVRDLLAPLLFGYVGMTAITVV